MSAELSGVFVTIGYLLILLAMAVVEVVARRRPDRIAPLGDMLDQVMQSRTVRLGVIAAWWWFGWHFLVAQTVQLNL